MALRFLHASDIHLLELSGSRPWDYLNKRFTGGVNLALNRAHAYDDRRFDEIAAAGRSLGVDRLVLTGDLTNLALEPEFVHVKRRLEAHGLPVTVIPGNHDAYVAQALRARWFETHLGQHMDGERPHGHDYPFVQRFGDVALVGVSTAIPTLPLYATGALGQRQLADLETVLVELGRERLTRVVLIHHPPLPGVSKRRHDLLDLQAFSAVLLRAGAELVLHGHEHRVIEGALTGPGDAAIPVHGISSGTALSSRPGRRSAFGVYEVDGAAIRHWLHEWSDGGFVAGPEREHAITR